LRIYILTEDGRPFGTRLCILDLTKGLRQLNLVEPTTLARLEEEL
jgi:hypothetical protein